jgi:hypothetical protein
MSLNQRLIKTNDAGGSASVANWVVTGSYNQLVYTTDLTLSGSTVWTSCNHPLTGTNIPYSIAYNGVSWVVGSWDNGSAISRILVSTDGVNFTQVYTNSTRLSTYMVWNGTYWTAKTSDGFFYTSDATATTGWNQYSGLNVGGATSYAWTWDGSSWITSQNNEDLYYRTDPNPVGAYNLWDDNNSNAIYYVEKNPNGWYIATIRGGVSSAVGQNIWRYDSLGGGRVVLSSNSTFGINQGGIHTSAGALVQQTNNQSSGITYARINSSGSIISVENASVYGANGRGTIYGKAYNGYSLAWTSAGTAGTNLIYRTGDDILATTGWSTMQPVGSNEIINVASSINSLVVPSINI